MKKGAIGAIIGFIVFFITINIIFISTDGPFMMIGTIFSLIFVFAVVFIFVGIIKTVRNNSYGSGHYHSQQNYQGTDNLKKCHKCQEMIDRDFEYCPSCGASQKNTIICEYCGHENPAENALCEKCNGFL